MIMAARHTPVDGGEITTGIQQAACQGQRTHPVVGGRIPGICLSVAEIDGSQMAAGLAADSEEIATDIEAGAIRRGQQNIDGPVRRWLPAIDRRRQGIQRRQKTADDAPPLKTLKIPTYVETQIIHRQRQCPHHRIRIRIPVADIIAVPLGIDHRQIATCHPVDGTETATDIKGATIPRQGHALNNAGGIGIPGGHHSGHHIDGRQIVARKSEAATIEYKLEITPDIENLPLYGQSIDNTIGGANGAVRYGSRTQGPFRHCQQAGQPQTEQRQMALHRPRCLCRPNKPAPNNNRKTADKPPPL